MSNPFPWTFRPRIRLMNIQRSPFNLKADFSVGFPYRFKSSSLHHLQKVALRGLRILFLTIILLSKRMEILLINDFIKQTRFLSGSKIKFAVIKTLNKNVFKVFTYVYHIIPRSHDFECNIINVILGFNVDNVIIVYVAYLYLHLSWFFWKRDI